MDSDKKIGYLKTFLEGGNLVRKIVFLVLFAVVSVSMAVSCDKIERGMMAKQIDKDVIFSSSIKDCGNGVFQLNTRGYYFMDEEKIGELFSVLKQKLESDGLEIAHVIPVTYGGTGSIKGYVVNTKKK